MRVLSALEMGRHGYIHVFPFCGNFAVAQLEDGCYCHIHRQNLRPVYKNRFDDLTDFDDQGMACATLNDNHFHIKTNGQPAYSQRFQMVGFFSCDLAWAWDHDGSFHIKRNGRPAYPQRYDEVQFFNQGQAWVRKGSLWLLIQPDGNPIFSSSTTPN